MSRTTDTHTPHDGHSICGAPTRCALTTADLLAPCDPMGSKKGRKRALKAGAMAVVALLAGCANMADIPPGTSIGDVYAQFGQPNTVCARPDGGQRMVWTQQPMGQYAWGTNVSPQGTVDRVYPVLTDENFNKLRVGRWTPDDLLCEFGRPAFIDEVGIPSVRQVVWNYRYREASSWNSLMYVYMGPNGDAVTRFHPGPDPMYEPRDGAFNW